MENNDGKHDEDGSQVNSDAEDNNTNVMLPIMQQQQQQQQQNFIYNQHHLQQQSNTMHMVPSQSNMPIYTPHVSSYTMHQQPPMVLQQQQQQLPPPQPMYNPMYHHQQQQQMYLFQQHKQHTTPGLYHSPDNSPVTNQQDFSPDQSPKSEPGTPDKRPKLTVSIPTQSDGNQEVT